MWHYISAVKKFNPDHACTVRHTQGTLCSPIFITNSFSSLSSRKTVNSIQPYRVSTLTQVPAPLRPQILLISISRRFHFPRQRQRQIKTQWVRGGTNNLTVGLPLTITSYSAALIKETILHMNSYVLCFTSRTQAFEHIHTPIAHPHYSNTNTAAGFRSLESFKLIEHPPQLNQLNYWSFLFHHVLPIMVFYILWPLRFI